MRHFPHIFILFSLILSTGFSSFAQISGDHYSGYPQRENRLLTFLRYNAEQCDSQAEVDFWWRLEDASKSAYDVSLLLFKSGSAINDACPTWVQRASREHQILVDKERITPNASNRVDWKKTFSDEELMGDDACASPYIRDLNRTLCLYVVDQSGLNEDFRTETGFAIDVDSKVPAAPTGLSALSADSRLTLSLDEPNNTDGDVYSIYIGKRACSYDDSGVFIDAGSSASNYSDGGILLNNNANVELSLTLDSLCNSNQDFIFSQYTVADATSGIIFSGVKNDVEYEFVAITVDDFGNISAPSAPILATPITALDVIDLYEGGKDPLGFNPVATERAISAACSARMVLSKNAPLSSLLLLIGTSVLFISRRRRQQYQIRKTLKSTSSRIPLAAFFLLFTFGFSNPALAYFGQFDMRLQAGPYSPALDLETVNGKSIFPVYNCLFKDTVSPRFESDVSMHLFDGFGSLQLGVGVGLNQISGKAQPVSARAEYQATGVLNCSEQSADNTSVEVSQLILRPSLIYNLDVLLEYFDFPLVPYARIGLIGSLYAFTKDSKFTESALLAGRTRAGFRLGVEGALGVMLALDFLEKIPLISTAGARISRAAGLWQHTYFSFEVVAQDVTTFGQSGPNLSPTDLVFKTRLPLFFNFGIVVEFT